MAPAGSRQLLVQGDVVPGREQGTTGEKEKTMTGTGTEAGTGTRTSTEMSTNAEMGAITGTIIAMRVEGRENLGTSEVVMEVGWKTLEGGRRQRVISNHSCKTQRPSETVAS